MPENLFIIQFLKKWKQVGAILPSSIFLVEDMLDEVDFTKARTIVELGAGSGSFTRHILRKMDKDAKLIVFEINDIFVDKLRKIKDPRITIINDSAVNISVHLRGKKADSIISGIPLSNLPEKIKNDIVQSSSENLEKGGVFLQFQYFPESLKLMKSHFSDVKLRFTLFNTPPAFFYVCRED